MDKSLPYKKIIVKSTFIKNTDNKDRTEKILNMIVDMLKNITK